MLFLNGDEDVKNVALKENLKDGDAHDASPQVELRLSKISRRRLVLCVLPRRRRRVLNMSAEDETGGWHLTESDPGVFTYENHALLRT